MQAARCSSCDINYPINNKKCLVCGHDTWTLSGMTWDTTWKDKVRILKTRWVVGQPLPNVDAVVYEVQGQHFISDEMLRFYGYLDVDTDSVVMIQNRYFEVNGRVKGTNDDGWWIEEIKPQSEYQEKEFKNLPTLTTHEYESLQAKRLRA